MKRTLALDLQSNEEGQKPLFQRLAEAIAGQIRRGTLQPGERLPSSRVLARELGVHRNTVLAALRELDLQGYIASEPARGTFVNREFRSAPRPRAPRRDPEPPAPVRFTLGEAPPARLPELPPGVLALVGGLPDMRQVPWAEYARAHRQALRSPSVLDYGSEYGDPRLLEALAEQLRTGRGVLAQTDELLITRGSQQALYLAAATL
ncbi:MAG TPA: GntR family transcriptional regulator, partial [Polyangiaceae bacterium]|nr:GntR family transcriptional regulator [Polyangiaceae bacterium]